MQGNSIWPDTPAIENPKTCMLFELPLLSYIFASVAQFSWVTLQQFAQILVSSTESGLSLSETHVDNSLCEMLNIGRPGMCVTYIGALRRGTETRFTGSRSLIRTQCVLMWVHCTAGLDLKQLGSGSRPCGCKVVCGFRSPIHIISGSKVPCGEPHW